jgi:hypothetical protein
MGDSCSTHGREEKCIQYFGWKNLNIKRPLGRLKYRWENHIRIDLGEIEWEDAE